MREVKPASDHAKLGLPSKMKKNGREVIFPCVGTIYIVRVKFLVFARRTVVMTARVGKNRLSDVNKPRSNLRSV